MAKLGPILPGGQVWARSGGGGYYGERGFAVRNVPFIREIREKGEESVGINAIFHGSRNFGIASRKVVGLAASPF